MEDIKKIEKTINEYTKKGEIQRAIEYCQGLLLSKPTDTNLYIRLGDLYLDWHLDVYQSKQYIDEAITEYQKAAEILIDNGEIYYKIGLALYYKGELDKAINYFNIGIEKGADIAQCHYMIANCLKKKDRFQDALEQIELGLKHAKLKSSRLHYSKFRLLNALYFKNPKMKYIGLCELFLSYLTLPFDKEAIKNLKDKLKWFQIIPVLCKADAYISQGDISKAFDCYSDAIEKMPGFGALYTALGDTYRKAGKLEEAVVEYKMALWIDSLSYSAYSGLVQAYEELGDYDNAIAYYNKYIAIHPNNAVLHSSIANLYFMKGEAELAVSHYQSAISLNPKPDWTSIVAQTLGYIQQNVIKNTDCAIANYQLANVLTPKEIDIYISLGSAFYDNEDYKNALIVYRRALELEPNNSKIHCNLGYLYWGMGDLDEAIKEYTLSIKFDPNYDIAHNNLGVIYLDDLVQLQNAIDCFNSAIECNPNYALAYYNLGRCYSLKNENIEAAKYFQQAMDVNNITNEIDPADIQDRLNSLFD
ncbi:MAG: tetratricopeptide repeat protein [Candidatus Gastranaerophilales bacterium]|nr:tetratricopeptide repeat protein [Candidatus Gastranaerophilales bacterium]